MSTNLRSACIKLAHTNPELRPHLLPLLKEAGSYADYAERKKKENKKPLAKEEWEARTQGGSVGGSDNAGKRHSDLATEHFQKGHHHKHWSGAPKKVSEAHNEAMGEHRKAHKALSETKKIKGDDDELNDERVGALVQGHKAHAATHKAKALEHEWLADRASNGHGHNAPDEEMANRHADAAKEHHKAHKAHQKVVDADEAGDDVRPHMTKAHKATQDVDKAEKEIFSDDE